MWVSERARVFKYEKYTAITHAYMPYPVDVSIFIIRIFIPDYSIIVTSMHTCVILKPKLSTALFLNGATVQLTTTNIICAIIFEYNL